MTTIDEVPLTSGQARSHRLAFRLLVPLLVVLVGVVVPLYFIYDYSQVSGDSMVPTLRNREYLLITRGWPHPRRGDVVVVQMRSGGGTEEIVKRVVALGGDRVSVRGDSVSVNGAPEAFAHQTIVSGEQISIDITVPADQIYLLGDNRPVSDDSRFFGPLPVAALHGRVVAVWAPITRMRLVPSP